MTATRNRRMKTPFGSLERAQLFRVRTRYDVRITTHPLQDPAWGAPGFVSPMDTSRTVVLGGFVGGLGGCSHEQAPATPPDRPSLVWTEVAWKCTATSSTRTSAAPGRC